MTSMKRGIIALLSAGALIANAQASDPLSFDYMVTGSQELRPIHIFHDGKDTYVQLPDTPESKGVVIKDAKAERYGPYILVRGIPQSFTLSSKQAQATVTYTGGSALSVKEHQEGRAASLAVDQPVAAVRGEKMKSQTRSEVSAVVGADACSPKVVRDEAAFMVGFERGSNRISDRIASKLRASIGDTANIERIAITVDSGLGAEPRGKALRAFIHNIGIPDEKIHTSYRQGVGLGTEMRVFRALLIPCRSGIHVEASSRDQVTIDARGDAAEIVRNVADATGLLFRIEGTRVPLSIEISERGKPLVLVLERIADRLGKRADLVLRNHELLIRYRQQ